MFKVLCAFLASTAGIWAVIAFAIPVFKLQHAEQNLMTGMFCDRTLSASDAGAIKSAVAIAGEPQYAKVIDAWQDPNSDMRRSFRELKQFGGSEEFCRDN